MNSAIDEIKFACISAFQLTDPTQKSTLPLTHFLYLDAEYNPNATRKRDQMSLMNAVLVHQQDSAEGPLYYPTDHVQLARDGIRDIIVSKRLRDAETRERNVDQPSPPVQCLVSLNTYNGHSSSVRRTRFSITCLIPVDAPTGIGQYETVDGEFWAKGLFQNLKQDASPFKFILWWRARMRFEQMRLNAGEPIDRRLLFLRFKSRIAPCEVGVLADVLLTLLLQPQREISQQTNSQTPSTARSTLIVQLQTSFSVSVLHCIPVHPNSVPPRTTNRPQSHYPLYTNPPQFD
jgi:hypothetical protein